MPPVVRRKCHAEKKTKKSKFSRYVDYPSMGHRVQALRINKVVSLLPFCALRIFGASIVLLFDEYLAKVVKFNHPFHPCCLPHLFLVFFYFPFRRRQVLQSKEEALRCAGRENRANDLEIASLKGDLAGEQRLRAAINAKLEEACSERDEVIGISGKKAGD